MSSLRELRERINTVASTAKITGAIKMIASAKVRGYERKLKQSEPFHDEVKRILALLHSSDGGSNLQSVFMSETGGRHVAVVALGSDGGLCGAYNINICRQLKEQTEQMKKEGAVIDLYPVGNKFRRVVESAKLQDVNIVTDFGMKAEADAESIDGLLDMLKKKFLSHEVDRVELMYMHFVNMTRQTFRRQTLFPVDFGQDSEGNKEENGKARTNRPCILEPDAGSILDNVLPLYASSRMYNAFMENATSTYAVRVLAMETASGNASRLNDELVLEYNKIRQEEITTELLDIQGGQTGQ